MNCKLEISFQRTIRVPDDGKTHNLSPGLSQSPIFNIATFAKTLPLDTVEKGGVFIAMYRMHSHIELAVVDKLTDPRQSARRCGLIFPLVGFLLSRYT